VSCTAPDYSQADEAQKKSLAAQKLAAALGDDDESNTNAAAAKPNNTTAQSNNRNSKPGTANKSYLMCLECFFDVTNLNLSAPGLSFGRHRLTVSPELSSFLSCCLSLNVHERPTPTQLLAHPYFAPMYSQRNQSVRFSDFHYTSFFFIIQLITGVTLLTADRRYHYSKKCIFRWFRSARAC
jgi:serine/threonine protein kinase